MISINIETLSEEAAADIAKILVEGSEEDQALIVLQTHGELTYIADDGNAEVDYALVNSLKEAAQNYAEDSDYGDIKSTIWCTVYAWKRWTLGDVTLDEERAEFQIAIDPEEPECSESTHEWVTPFSVLGGVKENPGVQGHGGGVIYKEICKHCGYLKVTDTWAQNPENGQQGLTSIRYEKDHEYLESWSEWKELWGGD